MSNNKQSRNSVNTFTADEYQGFSVEMISEIVSICKKYKVKSIALFGSLASNTMHSESDADFLVEFQEDLDVMDYADNYFSLLEGLEQVIGREVDLVSSNSLRNAFLIQEIDKTKVVLYAA